MSRGILFVFRERVSHWVCNSFVIYKILSGYHPLYPKKILKKLTFVVDYIFYGGYFHIGQYDILLLIRRKGINIAYYSICIAWNKSATNQLKKCCICIRKLKGSVTFTEKKCCIHVIKNTIKCCDRWWKVLHLYGGNNEKYRIL